MKQNTSLYYIHFLHTPFYLAAAMTATATANTYLLPHHLKVSLIFFCKHLTQNSGARHGEGNHTAVVPKQNTTLYVLSFESAIVS